MLKIKIKQEKEDGMEAKNPAPAAKKSTKILLNKAKGKKKGKSPLDKIKIKTLDEVRREKNIKKERSEVSSRAESTPSSTTTTTIPRTPAVFTVPLPRSKSVNHANVQLRQLSIPLMALPKGKHIIHTFAGSSLTSVSIKREPVDPQVQSSSEMTVSNTKQELPSPKTSVTTNHVSDSEPERQLNETDNNLFIRIKNKIKTEPSDEEDLNHNDVSNHIEDMKDKENEEMPSQGCCETLSEPSEENSELLSVDYSDVLLGSTQDDDTMSLFAFDNTFEEEMEPETPRKFTSDFAQTRPSKERDLRETLQNKARQKTQGEQRKVGKETNSRTVEDSNANERQSSKRDRFNKQSNERKKDNLIINRNVDKSLKVSYKDGGKNITGGGKKNKMKFQKLNNNKNRGKSIPNVPFLNPNLAEAQEWQRMEQLRHVVLSANPVAGMVAPMQPLLNDESALHYRDGKGYDPQLNRFRELRKPPPVSGGRGFFEDFKKRNENVLHFNHEDHGDRSRDGWRDKNERVVASGESKSARSHNNKEDSSSHRRSIKRGNNDDNDGGRAAKETKREKQMYCGTQLRLGECHHAYCRLEHLTNSELEEYKKTGKINGKGASEESPKPPEAEPEPVSHGSSTDEEPTKFLQHERALNEDEKEQMCKGLAEAANQLLDSLKLNEAWKVIRHLYQSDPVKREPLIKLLERTLFLCGEDGVDRDVASQVSSKVFKMIPKVRGSYNRHDFTTLMHSLCHTGQYIRGYEVLQEMRNSNITATLEVYLDLVHCSEAVPNWAFDLIEEVKALGLFKSSICSALILLGVKSGIQLLERTWKLFEDMMEKSVKPSKESFLAFIDFLAENNEGKKLMNALASHNDPSITLSAKCNKLFISHSKDNAELVSINVAGVCTIAQSNDPLLDVETWNILLRNCYSDKFNLFTEAQDVYSMMKKYNIPLTAEGYNGLLCALSESNETKSAMEVFNTLSLASGNIKGNDYRSCIAALIRALVRSTQLEDLELVVVFAIDNGLMVEEKALLLVIAKMEQERRFEEIHQLFKKLQSSNKEIPLAVFRKLVSTLEKWAVNPAASLAVYAAMKRAYPIIPDNAQHLGNTSSDSTPGPATKINKKGCRYFWTEKGCAFGSVCKYSHAPSDAPFTTNADVAAVNSTSPERNNPFVLKSASFPLSGITIPPPPQPPPYPFSMNTGVPRNNLVPPPAVFASNSPFVLKDPNPLTAFQPSAVPPVAFQFGFPQGSFFSQSVPVSGATSIQPDQKIPIPSAIQAKTERHSVELQSTATSVSTANARGSHSAPIMSDSQRDEGFHFPVKTELQFYKPKILKATEEKDLEELARLYVQMKKDLVPAKNEMLLLFYDFFITCKDIGESLSSFVAIIDIQLDNLDEDEDSSQKEALDLDDLKFIGELGVALMQFCRLQERLDEGYLVLHVLHQYGVNYFQYPASFVPGGRVLSSQGIALLATDMCLCLNKDPQFDGAVEVFRGCNYAKPQDESPLPTEDAEKRRSTFEKLCYHYLSVGNYALVYELLQHVGDKDVFGMTSLKSIYNELLKKYIAEEKVDDAIGVIREMENELISRDPNVLRALVTCLGNIGRFVQANDIFKSSCLQGAYPTFPLGDELWKATVWISFSNFEIQFYLEQHLQLLNKYVEQHRIASQLPYDEKHLKSLRIIITKEESSGYASNIAADAAKQMQEKIIDMLRSDFNPPLSCGISDKVGEVIVNPRSLRRWFLANPPPEMNVQTSPFSESDGSTELMRNVITSKGKPGITIRVDNLSHSDLPRTTLFEEYEPRIRHTVCGHLTRYLRQGKLASKEEFKRLARELTQDFLRMSNLADLNKDYRQVRGTVITFVDKYFVT